MAISSITYAHDINANTYLKATIRQKFPLITASTRTYILDALICITYV